MIENSKNGVNNTPNVEEIATAVAAPSAEIQKATYTNDSEGNYLLFSKEHNYNDLDVMLNEFTPNAKMREPRIKMPENLLEIARSLKSLYDDYKIEDLEIVYRYEKLVVNISWTDDTFVYFEIDEDERYGFDTYAPGGLDYKYSLIGNTVASIMREIEKSRVECRDANEYYKNEEKNKENDSDFSFQVAEEFLKLLKTDKKERQIRVDYYNDGEVEIEIEDNIYTWAKTYVRIFNDCFLIDILHDDYNEDDVFVFQHGIHPAVAAKEIWWAYVKEANKNNRRKYIMSLLGRKLSDFTKYIKEEYEEGDYNFHIETLAGEKIELVFCKECFYICRNFHGDVFAKLDIPYDKEAYTDSEVEELAEKVIDTFTTFIQKHQTNLDKLNERFANIVKVQDKLTDEELVKVIYQQNTKYYMLQTIYAYWCDYCLNNKIVNRLCGISLFSKRIGDYFITNRFTKDKYDNMVKIKFDNGFLLSYSCEDDTVKINDLKS